MLLTLPLLLLASSCIGVSSDQLAGDSPLVFIEGDSSPALQLAMRDVEQDWYKVLGYPPVVLTSSPTNTTFAGVPSQLVSVFIGSTSASWLSAFKIPSGCNLDGNESHCVFSATDPFRKNATSIVAIGMGLRGVIYAGYTFSEKILGVDPWYIWVDHDPMFKPNGVEVTGDVLFSYSMPIFKYRCIFTNDEDLLGGSKADPLGEAVFDRTTWDNLFETLLRLKGNMFLVGTIPFPDEFSLKLASRRGLVLTQHHFNLLALDTSRWLYGSDYWSWTKYPNLMAYSWKSGIAELQDREVVWSVGLRGLNDYSYPCPGCSDEEKAELISTAIGNQTAWIRAVQPDADLITYLWDEGANYFRKGLLHIPEGVHIIFTDEGAGFVQDIDLLQPGSGLYFHTAMLNGHANQLTEMVPPARFYEEGQQFVKKNATFAVIINTSDLRPVPLSTDAVLKFVWNPNDYLKEDPNSTQAKFISDWCQQRYELDADSATKIANAYTSYFNTPYIAEGRGDHYLANQLKSLASEYTTDLTKNGKASDDLAKKADIAKPVSLPHVAELNNTVASLESLIPAHRLRFFKSHLVMQVGLHLSALQAIDTLARSIIESSKGNSSGAISLGSMASEQLSMLFAYERMAEFGRWHGLYMHDWLVNYHRTRRILMGTVAQLNKLPPPLVQPGTGYNDFYAYQLVHNNFPYFYYNDTWNGRNFVIISCRQCVNTSDGGTFAGPSATISMEILQTGSTIHYTTDGSDPTASSPSYSEPITVTQTTTIKACGYVRTTSLLVVSNVTYRKISP
ncbi:uncharacterized protein [Oscarella lobularis]|uniref:uncharacterized protein n=1 Tax=Oscarella lobularis TaxID=121494 RepID=UPI0033133E97